MRIVVGTTIDLATGALRRITHHPDDDEGIRFTRDEQWAAQDLL